MGCAILREKKKKKKVTDQVRIHDMNFVRLRARKVKANGYSLGATSGESRNLDKQRSRSFLLMHQLLRLGWRLQSSSR